MFKNTKPVKLDPNTTDTLVGEGSIFEGKIKSGASVRVEGQVHGDIDCEGDVIVGEKGVLQSNIMARNVIIAGVVNGNVQARCKLSITSKGKLYGNISAASLSIDEGSIFEGTSRMEGHSEPFSLVAATQETASAQSGATPAEPASAAAARPSKSEEATYKTW